MVGKIVFIGSLLFVGQNSVAYIDPGTGSYVFQMLMGALLAVGFSYRSVKSWVKTKFTRKSELKESTLVQIDGDKRDSAKC
jgi:hypothetical protein